MPGPAEEGRGGEAADRDRARDGRGGPGLIGQLKLHAAIEETQQMVRATNRYLEEKAPWKEIKTAGPAAVGPTLWTAAEALRLAASLLSPVMPAKCGEILYRLGVIDDARALINAPLSQDHVRWGRLESGRPIHPGAPLFPRIESEKP